MYYYDEIRKYLSDLDNSFVKTVSSNFEYLATLCQQFCQCQSIYDHIKPASPVLTQYRSAKCRLTKGEDKKTEEDSLSILEKLSIELLWKLYLKSQNVIEEDESTITSKCTIKSLESSFINTFVLSISYKKNFEQFWKSLFDGTSFMNHYSKSDIVDALEHWSILNCRSVQSLNLSGLHSAMKLVEEGIKLPQMGKAESMEKLISDELLDYFLESAKAENFVNILFQSAPTIRAIHDGKIASAYPKSLKKPYEYNLEKIDSYIEEMKVLLTVYNEVMNDRKEFTQYI